tara:strand:+ start:121 stop:723 length:603 start_codon:yes stop_codon:yes gene_type:complete
MRHWFFYDANGQIKGQSTSYIGYAPGGDPNDPDTTCSQCLNDRQHNLVGPGNVGAVSYDCPHPTQAVGFPTPDPCNPNCFVTSQTHYVTGGVLTEKPTVQMVIDDGSPVDIDPLNLHQITRAPSTNVTFKLVGASVPDAHEITLFMDGNAKVSPTDLVLTFSGGETNTVNLTAPTQGVEGGFYWTSQYVVGSGLLILGFA